MELLAKHYPAVDSTWTEPGSVTPAEHPLVVYTAAYCANRLGRDNPELWSRASRLSTRAVFPSRPLYYAVLTQALHRNPRDATAHLLLGDLFMSSGRHEQALKEWQEARESNPALPTLHRNLGLTRLELNHDPAGAREIFREGLTADPTNPDLYLGLCRAIALLAAPPTECADAMAKYQIGRAHV